MNDIMSIIIWELNINTFCGYITYRKVVMDAFRISPAEDLTCFTVRDVAILTVQLYLSEVSF